MTDKRKFPAGGLSLAIIAVLAFLGAFAAQTYFSRPRGGAISSLWAGGPARP
ncbi:MAG: hypothetical protein ACHQAQ_17155 [Hyphomicrobiales bacterium]